MIEKNLTDELNKLEQEYHNSLNILGQYFRQNIHIIKRSRLSSTVKTILIKSVTSNYNYKVKKVTNAYNINKNNLIEYFSQISEPNSQSESNSQSEPTKKVALLIGINYINTQNELYGCINDTNNMKDILQSKFNYNIFNVLTDTTNKKPTKQNIINELTNLLVNANEGDSLFFLFSGHGTYTTDLSNDEADGDDEMIVPIDAYDINTCILDDEINNIIHKNLKPGVKLFMLFDSCFSGTVVDLKYNYLINENDSNSLITNSQEKETISPVIMISGCRDDQTSADAYVNYFNNNINSGAMTYSFLKTIQTFGSDISLKTLIEKMRIVLKENGFSQVPQLSSGTAIDVSTTLLSI